jgi:hypothetical protein
MEAELYAQPPFPDDVLMDRGSTAQGWCPQCRRVQPCIRQVGMTDWQVEPINLCGGCGRILHEAQFQGRARSGTKAAVVLENRASHR